MESAKKLLATVSAVLALAVFTGASLADVLVTTGGTRYEGQVLDLGGEYQLTNAKGGKMTFPKAIVARVEKSPAPAAPADDPRTAPVSPPTASPTKGPFVEPTVPPDTASKAGGSKKVMDVVATGIGSDPDKAIQAAFSQAIEQVVGVLVDAETIVSNDKIVRDQVRTYSKGVAQNYKVIAQWEEGGLRYARIRASVETGQLSASLKASNIATREVPGELLARQFKFDFKNEKEANEMLSRVLADFNMINLTKVEIVGKPEVTREGGNAEMTIECLISPKMSEWNAFANNLRPLLNKASTKKVPLTLASGSIFNLGKSLIKQLQGNGILIALFVETNLRGDKNEWNFYNVPELLADALRVKSDEESWGYRVVFALKDKDGKVLRQESELLVGKASRRAHAFRATGLYELPDVWWVGPVWCDFGGYPWPKWRTSTKIKLSADDLAKIANVTALLERAPKNK